VAIDVVMHYSDKKLTFSQKFAQNKKLGELKNFLSVLPKIKIPQYFWKVTFSST